MDEIHNPRRAGARRLENGPKVSCCVFAWNEVATLQSVVDDLCSALGRLGVPFEVLIIDDGSTDGTSEQADMLAANHADVRVVHHGINRGLGGTYRTGFESALGEFVTFFPADGQFPPGNIARLYPLAEGWDLVLGNLPPRRDSQLGAALGRVERLLYRALLGEIPRLEGVFMMRREILSNVELQSRGRGWTIVWELLVRAQRRGYRITGCAIIMQPRTHGTSKVNNIQNIAANLTQLWALRQMLENNPDVR
jgi:glycosyltransferase involved in cell wall biosynthesis